MAYVNFKEEKSKGHDQLVKRIKNNEMVYKEIVKDKESLSIKHDNKWSFEFFKDKVFNNEKTEAEVDFIEISGKNIVCSKFEGCKFYNIKFVNCTFIGCRFIECDFGGGGVIFENCSFFLECTKRVPNLNEKDNLSCEFNKCSIYVKFKDSILNYLIFEDCSIKKTVFELSDMTCTIINNSVIRNISFVDDDLSGAKVMDTYIEDLEFNDKVKTRLDERTFFDKIQPRQKDKKEYEGIYKTYETYADIFNANNLKNNFGEYYYQCKLVQHKSLDKAITKFTSFVYWATCGYGERMINTLITSLVIIFLFTILFLLFGIEIDGLEIAYALKIGLPVSFSQFLLDFNEALYISVAIFACVGAGGGTNPLPLSYIMADIEMIIGVIMIGVGIGVIVRKLVR